MAVSKRTRFEVLRRDNYTCRYCRSADNPLRVDHVTPVALGGTDDPANLVAACQDCNAGKASTSPDEQTVEQVNIDAARWAAAMEQASEIIASRSTGLMEYVAAFHASWPSYRYVSDSLEEKVSQFYRLGLPVQVMSDAAVAAGNAKNVNDRTAYFAGICWKKLREIQALAEQIVAGDDAP